MATDLRSTRSALRGLLVLDPRFTVDTAFRAADSTYTQAGPRPGECIAQQDSDLAPVALGDMEASKQLRIRSSKGGMPGLEDSDAGFTWCYQGDTVERGSDVPGVIVGWESVLPVNSLSTQIPRYPHLVPLDRAGRLVMAYGWIDGAVGVDRVQVKVRSGSPPAWGSAVTVWSHDATFPSYMEANPAIVTLPNGRLLCFHWVDLSNGNAQIRMHYSDDDGASWAVGSKYVLPAELTYEAESLSGTNTKYSHFQRIRAAYNPANGEILMMLSVRSNGLAVSSTFVRDLFLQYASTDLGSSFTFVRRSDHAGDPTDTGRFQDVVVANGSFIVGYAGCRPSEADYDAKIFVLGSAFDPWVNGGPYQITADEDCCDATNNSTIDASGVGYYVHDGDFALAVGDGNIVYAVHRVARGGTMECLVARSLDLSTWEYLGQSSLSTEAGPWFASGDASTYLEHMTAAWTQGQLGVAFHWNASPGDEDDSIAFVRLGGSSTVTMPAYATGYDSKDRVGFEVTWLPIELPGDTVWTKAGGGTETLSSGRLHLTTSATAINYTDNPSGTVAEGLIIRGAMQTVSGGTVLSDAIVLTARVADSTDEYEVKLRLGASKIRVMDTHGSSGSGTIVGDHDIDLSAGVEFLVALAGSTVKTWFRSRSSASDRKWEVGPETTTLTNASSYTTAASNHEIKWGHLTSTAETYWYELHYSHDEWTGQQLTDFSNPDDLHHHRWVAPGSDVYVDLGTRIYAKDGPTVIGDVWHCDTEYSAPAENMLPWLDEPSPQVPYESTDASSAGAALAAATFCLPLDATVTAASPAGNDLVGFACFNANVRTGTYQRDSGSSSFNTIATWDASVGMASMAFTRSGAGLKPTSGGNDEPYFFLNECKGWTAILDNGANTYFRKVLSNTEGKWGTTGKPCHLMLEGMDGTEPASGTLTLVPLDFVVLCRLGGNDVAAYRLGIDSQSTVDDKLRLGTWFPGLALVHGWEQSWGRNIETRATAELQRSEDGTKRARRRGPVARRIQYGWLDGVDMTGIHDDAPDLDYFTSTSTGSAPAVATWRDTPMQMEGAVSLLDGPVRLVVYLPKIDMGPPDVLVLNRRHQFMLARLVSPVSIGNVQGDELVDEVVRVAQVELEEEV